jgi:hypothetical protein
VFYAFVKSPIQLKVWDAVNDNLNGVTRLPRSPVALLPSRSEVHLLARFVRIDVSVTASAEKFPASARPPSEILSVDQ